MKKNWEEFSDKEFDDWLKASSENHQEPLWEGAWKAMESKLDEKKERKIIPFWWKSAAAILIFGLAGSYFFLNNQKEKTLVSKGEDVIKDSITTPSENFKTETSAKFDEKAKSQISEKVQNKVAFSLPEKNTVLTGRNQDSGKKYFSKKIAPIETIKGTPEPFVGNSGSNKGKDFEKESEIAEKINLAGNETPKLQVIDTLTQVAKNQKGETTIKYDIEILTKDLSTENSDSIVVLSEEHFAESQQTNSRKRMSRWAINFGASPDYSSVALGQAEPIGYNIQVGLSFNISSRLQIRTAVIRSLKLYEAYAEDYAWPAKWGTPSSPLIDVGASCNMLDLPVSLTYFISQKNKNSFYTSLGLTNYYMLKEKYEYHYENNDDPNLKWKQWEGSTGFAASSVANVSFGLQRKLNSKITVQIEPFVKIPLRSIGFGNVKLYSAGMFFNIIPTNIFRNRNHL